MIIKNTRDTMSDVYLDALRIRNEVFVKEQGVPYALEVGSPVEEAMAVHFVAYSDSCDDEGCEKALGTVRLLMSQNYESGLIQRMAVLKFARETGVASGLMDNLAIFAQEHKIHKLTLHAQLSARGFYDKMGYLPKGEIFEEAGIQHITMVKTLP
ncbi:GNAT family N-acetyltransferase [Lactovum odontotermitis]